MSQRISLNMGGFRRFYKPPEPGYPGFRYRSIREICSQKAVYFPNASGALPIPAAACKMIKSVYSAANGYAGYFNYMQYWAKNGSYNQICDISEYAGSTTGMETVNMTYKATNFWNNYDGTKSPVSGSTYEGGKIANGWPKKKAG